MRKTLASLRFFACFFALSFCLQSLASTNLRIVDAGEFDRLEKASSCLNLLLAKLKEDQAIYVCNYCVSNVARLVQRFKEQVPSFDIRNAHLLYFYPTKNADYIRAFETPAGPNPWRFHAVLEYEGKVLDFDHGDLDRVHHIADYVSKMFLFPSIEAQEMFQLIGITTLTNEEILDSIQVRRIPAEQHLSDYLAAFQKDQMELWEIGISEPELDERYPPTLLREFVPNISITSEWTTPETDRRLIAQQEGEWLFRIHGGEPISIDWANHGVHYRLDLVWGRVQMFKGDMYSTRDRIQDLDKTNLFLRRVFLRFREDKETLDFIRRAVELRRQKNTHR